jgi:hypothetical protein
MEGEEDPVKRMYNLVESEKAFGRLVESLSSEGILSDDVFDQVVEFAREWFKNEKRSLSGLGTSELGETPDYEGMGSFNKRWSPLDVNLLLQLYRADLKPGEIAKRMNRSERAVRTKLDRLR